MAEETRTATTTREAPAYASEIPEDYSASRKTEPMAVVSVVLGVVGFIVPFIASVLALLFGYPARKRIREHTELRGDGMALTGIILGWVALAFYLLVVLVVQFGGGM